MKILLQKTAEGGTDWGSALYSGADETTLAGYVAERPFNDPITFKEADVTYEPTPFERYFADQTEHLCQLTQLLTDTHMEHQMTVGAIHGRNKCAVELQPEEEILQGRSYGLTHDYYYNQQHDWRQLAQLSVPMGGLFKAGPCYTDKNGGWHTTVDGIDCIIASQTLLPDQTPAEGLLLLYAATDHDMHRLVAVANPEQLDNCLEQNRRIVILSRLTATLWLCQDMAKYTLMQTQPAEARLLAHLRVLYGKLIPVLATPLPPSSSAHTDARCQWGRVACGSDYNALFATNPLQLQVPLSAKTPRVLYYDVVLTATEEQLAQS